ncbi:hypothetical protein ACTQ4Q_04185 [Bacillota bacterium LCP21S3_D9]
MSHNLSNKAYENKVRYNVEYAKNNYKRVPLDLKIDKYEQLKAAAEKSGESVNGYIKTAVEQRIQRESD